MLTDRENEVLMFIQDFYRHQQTLPSARQIGAHFGFKSSRSAQNYIDALKDKGVLRHRNPETSSYTLLDAEQPTVPLLGCIAAGSPLTVFEGPERTLPINGDFFGKGQRLFALQVQGDSMSGDYICDGDIAMIRSYEGDANERDIYAVRVEEESFTLKRVKIMGDRVALLASNPRYQAMLVSADAVAIVGVYAGLVRKSALKNLDKPGSI